jgi:hypothetical protein
VSTPVPNLIGKAGQTVNAGSFTYTNSEEDTTEELSSVTVSVSDPAVLASLTLTASYGESTQSLTATPPSSSTTFAFDGPINVPPGGSVNFSLSAVIAGTASPTSKTRSMVVSFNTGGGISGGPGSGSAINSAFTMMRDTASAHGFMLLASALLPMLLLSLVFQAGARPRFVAAGFAMAMLGMAVTGCDPCPACTTAKLTTTDQRVVAVAVTADESQVGVAGIPALVSQLSK